VSSFRHGHRAAESSGVGRGYGTSAGLPISRDGIEDDIMLIGISTRVNEGCVTQLAAVLPPVVERMKNSRTLLTTHAVKGFVWPVGLGDRDLLAAKACVIHEVKAMQAAVLTARAQGRGA
jgi:hypothetical protein